MDTRQLDHFVAIYENGTLSGAAAAQRLAISAISRHLTNLEQDLGTRLFTRKARGLEPTAAGHRLKNHATLILKAMADAETDVRQAGGVIAGEVSIGMAHTAIKAIGVEFVERVLTDFPQVKLSLTESLSGATLMNLMATDIDLALVFNPPSDGRVKSQPVLEEQLVCVGTAKLLGTGNEPISLDDVLELPLILLRRGASSRAIVDDAALLKKLEARARLQMDSVQAITGSLLRGLGCAVGTELFVREHIESGMLVHRPIVSPQLSRKLYLCELASRPPRFALEAMSGLIMELLQNSVERGDWKARMPR